MSQADELLNGLSGDDIAMLTAEPETEPHIVVGRNRYITVPETLKRIAVQNDHNVETVTFDCPRYWDGHDLSAMKVYIHYRTSNGIIGRYLGENVTIDEVDNTIFHFTWTISNNVTGAAGNIKFLVCAKDVDLISGEEKIHWNSEPNSDLFVSAGLDCNGDDILIEQVPDIATQLLLRMEQVEETVKAADLDEVKAMYDETNELLEGVKVDVTGLETVIPNERFATESHIQAKVVSNGINGVLIVEQLSFMESIDGVLSATLVTLPESQCPVSKMEFALPTINSVSENIDFVSIVIDTDGTVTLRMGGAGDPCSYELRNVSACFTYPLKRIIVAP